MQIDHVIVGVSDLDVGMQQLERLTGVRAVVGGAHPGQGTQNALLSLGDGVYLELYAPDPKQAIDSPAVNELRSISGLKPIGWAVSTSDVDALRRYLGSHGLTQTLAEPGARLRPDGSVIEWVTFGYEAFDHPLAPFFIRWKQLSLHPSRTSPGGCRLSSLRLHDQEPSAIYGAVQPLGLNVHVSRGERGMEVRLSCPRGPVALQ